MLVIRFQRVGRKNDPAFRVVVAEKRSKPKSAGVERLGSYHPKTKETVLDRERILYWISKGAKLSDTVHNLLVSKGVIRGKKRAVVSPSKLKKAQEAVVPEKEKPVVEKAEEVSVSASENSIEEKPEEDEISVTEEKPTES